MANQIPSDPANEKIATLTQDQLNVSRSQFSKINAQNEALGAVILELAASQAQQEEIEARQVKREKFYRRRDFIFNQIVARFQRVSAKKAAIAAENQANRDLIEQKAQVDNAQILTRNSNIIISLTELMQRDISTLTAFMMGNKLQDEENRREMLAALKRKGGKGVKREEFEEKKYSGFLKTLGRVLFQVPFFLIGFFQGYFNQLGKLLRGLGAGPALDKVKGFVKNLNTNVANKLKEIFSAVGKKLKPIGDFAIKVFKFLKKVPVLGAGIQKIQNLFMSITGGFTKVTKGPIGKAIIKIASNAKIFGTLLGRLFLPINVIIAAFAAFKGFMKGYQEGGIVEGLKQGVIGVFDALIGSVLKLGANISSFLLGLIGLDNTGDAIKGYMDDILGGITGFFSSYIDLVKAVFTLDFEGIKTALVGIFESVKQFLFAPIQVFKGLISDIFGNEEETGLLDKIKSVWQRIQEFFSAPLEKITGFLNKLNPFSKSDEEIRAEIEKEQARIDRSQQGDDEYFGREEKGRAKSVARIEELRSKLAQNGAEMAAIEKENADRKAERRGRRPTIINNNYQVDNSQTNTATTFHQGNMMDEGLVAVGG